MEKNKDFYKGLIADIAKEYKEESVGSLSYSTNAKAIALNNVDVQNKILENLLEEKKLVSVKPITGYGSLYEYVLRFSFQTNSEKLLNIDDDDMLVTIDIASKSVVDIEYPIISKAVKGFGKGPLTTDMPITEHSFFDSNFERYSEKDFNYFRDLGIRPEDAGYFDSGGGLDTNTSRWTTYVTRVTGSYRWTTKPSGHGQNDRVTDDDHKEGKNDYITDD